jgi:hypothetical protein
MSSPGDSMATRVAGNLTPWIEISRPLYIIFVLSIEPGDCTTMILSKSEGENLCKVAKLREINEWEALESNKIIAGMSLTENIPRTMSGASQTSSAEMWWTHPWLKLWLGRCPR